MRLYLVSSMECEVVEIAGDVAGGAPLVGVSPPFFFFQRPRITEAEDRL